MQANMTVGEAAIELLERYGVDTVFGIPGVHTLELYRGLPRTAIRHIAVRHEQGAGFMADGYARASGRPGVCLLITGPGLTNAATPIGQAFSDSVPMLVLSGVNATGDLGRGRGRLHELTSQQAAMAPLTAFSRTVCMPDELSAAMADAFAVFSSGRPRPVHIEVPLDVMAKPAAGTREVAKPLAPPPPEQSAVQAAAAVLAGAPRRVVIAGGGTVDCAGDVLAVADALGAAITVTTAAKGVVPEDHPRYLGATLSWPETQGFIAGADVALAVGTELAETDWWLDAPTLPAKLVRIDIDAATLVRDRQPDAAILGEAGASLRALKQALSAARPAAGAITTAEVAAVRARHRAALTPLQRKHAAVLDALREALPDDGIVASDMTQIAYTANHYFPCRRPRCWFHPLGYGTLGYGLPAAIGAKLAAPERAVVALAGDAGFLFTVQELGTAAELGLPLAILLWNNDALGQIAGDMRERGIAQIGVAPRNPDYLALARAFGCDAVRPDSLAGLRDALRGAFTASRPTLIEVRQDAAYLP
jgi:thiamine pyrophosphate-dependent acetolactate synthase large subunit-like protein